MVLTQPFILSFSFRNRVYVPSGSDRFIWSAKIWVGNCPLYSPIFYAPDYVIYFIFKKSIFNSWLLLLELRIQKSNYVAELAGGGSLPPKKKNLFRWRPHFLHKYEFPRLCSAVTQREESTDTQTVGNCRFVTWLGFRCEIFLTAHRMGPTYLSIRNISSYRKFQISMMVTTKYRRGEEALPLCYGITKVCPSSTILFLLYS